MKEVRTTMLTGLIALTASVSCASSPDAGSSEAQRQLARETTEAEQRQKALEAKERQLEWQQEQIGSLKTELRTLVRDLQEELGEARVQFSGEYERKELEPLAQEAEAKIVETERHLEAVSADEVEQWTKRANYLKGELETVSSRLSDLRDRES